MTLPLRGPREFVGARTETARPVAGPRGEAARAAAPVVRGGGANWQGVLVGIALPPAMWAAMWTLTLIGDSTRVNMEVMASRQQGGVMVCHDGRIRHDDEGLIARWLEDGQFVCTDWRLRETPSLWR